MDDTFLHYALFLLATFAGALVAGLAGFAFGLIAAAVWLHILPPLQTATFVASCSYSCSCPDVCWSFNRCDSNALYQPALRGRLRGSAPPARASSAASASSQFRKVEIFGSSAVDFGQTI